METDNRAKFEELNEIRAEHLRRAHQLEKQIAAQGSFAPAHIVNDLENAKREIERIDTEISAIVLQSDKKYFAEVWVRNETSDTDRLFVVYKAIAMLENAVQRDVSDIRRAIEIRNTEDDTKRLERQIKIDRYLMSILLLLCLILLSQFAIYFSAIGR